MRKEVFNYQNASDFPTYIRNVEEFSNEYMGKDVGYFTRPIKIIQPLEIESDCIKVGQKVFLKCIIRSLLDKNYPDKMIDDFGLLKNNQISSKTKMTVEEFISYYTQNLSSFNLKMDATQVQGIGTQIPEEYLDFLDHQLCNSSKKSLLLPGESINILYEISRRELLKFNRSQTKPYFVYDPEQPNIPEGRKILIVEEEHQDYSLRVDTGEAHYSVNLPNISPPSPLKSRQVTMNFQSKPEENFANSGIQKISNVLLTLNSIRPIATPMDTDVATF